MKHFYFAVKLLTTTFAVSAALMSAIFVLAAIGLWLTRRYRGELVPVYLVIGSTVLLNVLLYSIIRFRAPIEPLLVILAAAGLTMIPWRRWAIRTGTA